MSNAFQKYASTGAELDFNEQRLRRMLAQRLMLSKELREEALTTQRESDSARGLLQSGIALKNQTNKNIDYDRADADAQQTADDTLAGIGRSRAQASADYLAAKAEEERQATLTTPLLQEVDPTDPLGWKKIAEQMAASGDPNFTNVSDPNNWAGIAEEQKALGNPDYTGMATAAVKSRTNKTPVRSINKAPTIFRQRSGVS